MCPKKRGYFKRHLDSRLTEFSAASSSPRSLGSYLADKLLVRVVECFGKLMGYFGVEAALDELLFKDTSHMVYVLSDVDWKPKQAWKHLQDIVS